MKDWCWDVFTPESSRMNGHRKQSKKTGFLDRYEKSYETWCYCFKSLLKLTSYQSMKDIYILETQQDNIS